MNLLDQLQPVEGMGPVGEFRLVPDPESFVILPYVPNAAAMMSDMIQLDRTPWPACPRSCLKRQIARAAEEGMTIQAAFEGEFSLFCKEGDGSKMEHYIPVDNGLCFSSIAMHAAADVVDAFMAAFSTQNIAVDDWSDAERQDRNIQRYPTTQAEVLDALEADPVLMTALGTQLANSYITVKRSEFEAFRKQDVEFEILNHICKF